MNNGVIKRESGREREEKSEKGDQSVTFQVYTGRKRADLCMTSRTSAEHNINTSVVIMFHATCKQGFACRVLVLYQTPAAALTHTHTHTRRKNSVFIVGSLLL